MNSSGKDDPQIAQIFAEEDEEQETTLSRIRLASNVIIRVSSVSIRGSSSSSLSLSKVSVVACHPMQTHPGQIYRRICRLNIHRDISAVALAAHPPALDVN